MATSAKPAGADTGHGTRAKKLLLIDGHSMAFRAFYALPAEKFTIAGGDQATNAVYGFTAMLVNVVRDEKPTHLAVCFDVSRTALERTALAQAVAAAVNPELCLITEDLVFSEPSVDAGRNSVLTQNKPDADDLAADEEFITAMGRAKWLFMTKSEALIHGDLHTGSVMVRAPQGSTTCDSVKAFDSEFAFYGPVAFDLGALWANYAIAAARAYALGNEARAAWALSMVQETWDAFEDELLARAQEIARPRHGSARPAGGDPPPGGGVGPPAHHAEVPVFG